MTLLQSTGGALRIWSNRHATVSTSPGWSYGHAPGGPVTGNVLPGPKWAHSAADVWVLPYWLMCLLTGLPALACFAIIARAEVRARRDPNACPHCGYDLRASPDRCPECGQPAAATPIA